MLGHDYDNDESTPWCEGEGIDEKILEWCQEYSYRCRDDGRENLLVRKLRSRGLNSLQVYAVLKTVEEVCSDCWDYELGCGCRNDE